ncbi:MAG TPA: FAD-binding oxidoreductase [Rhodospirillales bacterium]|nr:FAD-binding oxidoreductase [Rhodospirillales bacterium]
MSSSAVAASPVLEPELHDRSRPPATYWHRRGGPLPVGIDPLTGDAAADVAIVGGGFTGLSAALHLARDHGLSVRLLEAGAIGWGASGRNGGFCCLGGGGRGWREVWQRFGEQEARSWFAAQKEAIALVADLARRHRIDLQRAGEGELVVAHRPRRREALEREALEVAELFGENWDILEPEELAEQGVRLEENHGALVVPYGFGLHPLRYARGLARAAVEQGARVHERSPVVAWETDGRLHRLHTEAGTVRAARVLIATNGHTPEGLAPELAGRVLPVLSCILVTRPLTLSERAAQGWTAPALLSDTRRLLFYMRLLPDHRLLFGARGGVTGRPEAFARRVGWMRACLAARFPAWRHVAVDHAWWGYACLARDRLPHLASIPGRPGAWLALAYHGNGVAMASWFGAAAAARLAGRGFDGPLPAFVTRPPPRFPVPALRPLLLRAVYAWYGVRDRWP